MKNYFNWGLTRVYKLQAKIRFGRDLKASEIQSLFNISVSFKYFLIDGYLAYSTVPRMIILSALDEIIVSLLIKLWKIWEKHQDNKSGIINILAKCNSGLNLIRWLKTKISISSSEQAYTPFHPPPKFTKNPYRDGAGRGGIGRTVYLRKS